LTAQATVIFSAARGAADGVACELGLYVQGVWSDTEGTSAPLLTVTHAQAVADGEAEVQLLEGVRYEYELSNAELRLALERDYVAAQGIVLRSRIVGRGHCGVLNPGLATGLLPLVVLNTADKVVARGGVEVRSRKLTYKADYQQMLTDITERCVGLLQELRSPSSFKAMPDVGDDVTTLGQRFAFVRALLQSPSFENALHRIATHPHEMWQREAEHQPIARGSKLSGKVQRQLARGGRRVAVPATHPLHARLPTLPTHVSVTRATRTDDTPENRFVKFALRSFHRFLDEMRGKVNEAKDKQLHDEIKGLCERLDVALSADVLRRASEPTFLPLGSPVLQRREGYREVLQAWVHFQMAAKLVWAGGEKVYGAGQRDVATLYEYWVFFALLKVVAQVFSLNEPEATTLIERTVDGFGLKLKAGRYLALTGKSMQPGRNLEVRFSYNRSFKATNKPRAPGSWTHTLRPDYTLSLWPVGFTEDEAEQQELMVHVHFDAKYRLDQVADLLGETLRTGIDSEVDAAIAAKASDELDVTKSEELRGTYKRADLLKMHAYRDAIRRTQGAYVIYPGHSGDATRLTGFHEVLPGLGAFALRPGSGTDALTYFLHDVVSHVADRASAREQQSFHTYQIYERPKAPTAEEERGIYGVLREKELLGGVRATPPSETFVVIGWVKSREHLDWIRSAGKYNFRMGGATGALRLSASVIGATYLLLHGDHDVAVPGLFRIKAPASGPTVCTSLALQNMGYPTAPTQTAYLVYDVEAAVEFDDCDWDFASLGNKPAEAAHGHPFATDLCELLRISRARAPKSAQEL